MTAIQLKNLRIFLRESSLTYTDEWLTACIDWVKENYNTVTDAILRSQVLEQWQDTNLEDMESRCLPPNLSEQRCVKLTGRYGLQVNSIQDIGESAYNQWNRLKKLENENTNVAATDSTDIKTSWEPKSRRCLYLTMTDGSQKIYGLELNLISSLSVNLKPGAKIIVMGPVECRRGVLQLKSINIKVIGGEVEDLLNTNSVESLLQNILHNPPENLDVIPIPAACLNNQRLQRSDAIVGDFPDTADIDNPDEFSVFDDDDIFMEIDESEMLASASLNSTIRANAVTQRIDVKVQTEHAIDKIQRPKLFQEPTKQIMSTSVQNQNQIDIKRMPPPRGQQDQDVTVTKSSSKSKFVPPGTKAATSTGNSVGKTVKNFNKSTTVGSKTSTSESTSGAKSKKQLKIDGYMKPMPVIIKPPTPQKFIEDSDHTIKIEIDDHTTIVESDEDDIDDKALMDIIDGSFAAELEKAEKESSMVTIKTTMPPTPTSTSGVTKSSNLGVVRPTTTLKIMLPIIVSKRPYVFIKQVQENIDRLVERREIVHVKACIATVVSNIQVKNGEWALSVSINDGTGFLNCQISSEILNNIIGFNPSEMKRIKSARTLKAKEQISNGMAVLTSTLVHLNTIFAIELQADPVIVEFGDVMMHHTRGLKDRISQLPNQ